MKTVFEQIIDGNLPSDKVFESDAILVIKDIQPQAPVHLLLLPKKHWENLQAVPKLELPTLIGEIAAVAQQLAEKFKIADNYRLLTNNGSKAGQTVFHLHFHLIGGRELGGMA
ncbi:MAG: HIT domain-containing protein [Chlamydiota bacterium]